jgi:O-antigen ligase
MHAAEHSEHGHSRRDEARVVGWLLLLPLPLATALFATVHPWPRAALAVVTVSVGLYGLVAGLRERSASVGRAELGLLFAALFAVGAGLVALVPVSAATRAALQPGVARVVEEALGLAKEGARHPLALHPQSALLASGEAAAAVLFAAAVATAVRSRRRMIRLAGSVVVTALAVVLLAWAQRFGAAEAIYWSSGVPASLGGGFFGPFVNPNHAAFLLATALPLAAVLLTRGEAAYRLGWTLALAMLLLGLWTTTSRGGLIAAAVGLSVMLLLASPRPVVIGLSGLGGLVGLGVGVVGLRPAAEWLTLHILPAAATPDVFGDRDSFWADAWALAKGAPLLGVGQGSFGEAEKVVKVSPVFSLTEHAHQEPLQALAEHGLIVGSLWILLCLAPAAVAIRRLLATPRGRRRSLGAAFVGAYAALATACLYEFPLRAGALAILAALLAGVLFAVERPAAIVAPRGWLAAGLVLGALSLLTPVGVLLDDLAPGSLFASPAADLALSDQRWDEVLLAEGEPQAAAAASASAAAARAALLRVPTSEWALAKLARAEAGLGHTERAREALQIATRVYPSDPWTWLALARFEAELSQTPSARAAWSAGLALDLPEDVDAMGLIVEAFSSDPDPAGGLELMIPDRADRLRDAGRVLARDGRPEWQAAAREAFERSVGLDPTMGLAFAVHLNRWGEPARALALIEAVPDRNCGTLLAGAEARLDLNRAAEAVEWYQRARAKCGKDDRPSRVGLARAKAAAGDPAAIELLRALLREEPALVGLRRLLIRQLIEQARPFAELEVEVAALVDAGQATPFEVETLSRLRAGLPPQLPSDNGAP